MKLYKAVLHPVSSLTRIPDAQTIFGAICSIIRFTKGEEALNMYLSSFDENPIFVHSSMFIDGLLPMAKVGLISIKEKNQNVNELNPAKQLEYITGLKKLKKITHVSIDVYQKYIVNEDFNGLKEDILNGALCIENGVISTKSMSLSMKEELITHNNKRLLDTSDESNARKLFYDNDLYLSSDSNVCIYFKTDNKEYVESIFKYFPYFGIGNRITVGKNCFNLLKIEEIKPITYKNSYRMLLSKSVGDADYCLEDSKYMIDSIVLSGSKYYSSNVIGRFNKFVEGSYMKVESNKEYYGKLLKLDNGKTIFHYGIGFVL